MSTVLTTLERIGSLPPRELAAPVSFGLLAWGLLAVGFPLVAMVLSAMVTATTLAAAQEVER